jgi:conjugative transfer signal peptidase TraF
MKFAQIVLIPTAVVIIAILGGVALGVRLNVTPSVPTGLYLQSRTPAQVVPGMLVVACLDAANEATAAAIDRGYLPQGNCPGNVAPVLKPVAAFPGDRVTATKEGLFINGHAVPRTAQLAADPQGRPIPTPAADYVVPPSTVLLLVDLPSSFDGRYFGPLPAQNIKATARPLLLF